MTPEDSKNNISETMSKLFPNPSEQVPSKRLSILISILVFVVVVGLVSLYQVYKKDTSKVEEAIVIPKTVNKVETYEEQQKNALIELKEMAAKSPPITDKERAAALLELRKAALKQKK